MISISPTKKLAVLTFGTKLECARLRYINLRRSTLKKMKPFAQHKIQNFYGRTQPEDAWKWKTVLKNISKAYLKLYSERCEIFIVFC